jgi:Glyoxalase-like domain
MSVRWYSVVIDCHDVAAQSRWWAQVLDWRVGYEAADEVVVVPPHVLDETRSIPVGERGPGLVFVPVPEGKNVKNRLHIDLAPPEGEDQAAEVRRLEALGARPVDVGQDPGKVTWVVLADPEGNEFASSAHVIDKTRRAATRAAAVLARIGRPSRSYMASNSRSRA